MGTLLSLPQTFRKAVDCLGPFTYLGSYHYDKKPPAFDDWIPLYLRSLS